MAAPTPIHRDPDLDGDDYGCIGRNKRKGNAAIAALVLDARRSLMAGAFADADEVVDFIRAGLEEILYRYGCGSYDTIVKENVFAALHDAVDETAIGRVDRRQIYGW
jgi:hypothetical protein